LTSQHEKLILVVHLYYFMTLGGANVWTNFSYGYCNKSPSGWLLSPDRNRIILFAKNKKSERAKLKVFAHTYYTNEIGEPAAIKSSKQMPLDDAWNQWHDLQLEGWTFEELELPE